jgi:hypothetical protein
MGLAGLLLLGCPSSVDRQPASGTTEPPQHVGEGSPTAPASAIARTSPAEGKDASVSKDTAAKLSDAGRAARVKVVLRVKLVAAEGGDKTAWDKVDVLHVIKNETGTTFAGSLEIAHYSWEPGIPAGTSTVYLEPYEVGPPTMHWKLLGGSAKEGVSHPEP